MTASAQQASPSGAEVPALPGGLSMRALAMMDRVSDPRVSPDGRRVLYSVRSTDWEGNRGVSALWVVRCRGRRTASSLPISTGGASTGRWAATARRSISCRRAAGRTRSGARTRTGNAAVQVTTLSGRCRRLQGFAGRAQPDPQPCRSSSTATRSSAPRTGSTPTTVALDRHGLRPDAAAPVRPLERRTAPASVRPASERFGPGRRRAARPDGRDRCRHPHPAPGRREASSPSLRTAAPSSIRPRPQVGARPSPTTPTCSASSIDGRRVHQSERAPIEGSDGSPAFSPDGRRLAWLAGRRENVGGDQAVVMVADADGSNARVLVDDWDRGPGGLRWRSDSRSC